MVEYGRDSRVGGRCKGGKKNRGRGLEGRASFIEKLNQAPNCLGIQIKASECYRSSKDVNDKMAL